MDITSKLTINGITYPYDVSITSNYRRLPGSISKPNSLYSQPCHEHHAHVRILDGSERAFNIKVLYHLDEQGRPNRHLVRYIFNDIIEARLPRFIKRLLNDKY